MDENLNSGIAATEGQTTGVDSKPERTFTQSQVNELMKKRVDRSHNAFFTRYGVKDLAELDDMFGKVNSYDSLQKEYDDFKLANADKDNQIRELTKKYAYKVGNVNPEKTNDIETYFKGKNLEIDENTLAEELKTHPEWVTKVSSIQPLGAESAPTQTVDERELASKYFGVNFNKRR